jgi:hypothetical protein
MPQNVLYIRGEFPLGLEPGIPLALIRDTKVVLVLTVDQLKAIANDLNTFTGFMDSNALKGVITSHVHNEEHAQSLFRVVSHLDQFFRATKQPIEAFFSGTKEKLSNQDSGQKLLSETEFQELQRRLPFIAKKYPGLGRFAKAHRLSEAIGMPLEDLQIICDVRPVFDEEHTTLDGVIPYTTLKVVCKGVDGLPVQIEAILSYNQVARLAAKATDAEKKLKVLGELLQGKGFCIPPVETTKRGE